VTASTSSIDVRAQPLGGGPLARALVAGTASASWSAPRPTSPRNWLERGERARRRVPSDWLDRLWPALQPSGAAADRIRRAAAGGFLVTTGQQPGLFGGPLYTLYKALTALELADALERECSLPVAPVFWAATDDTDIREASIAWTAVPGGLEELMCSPDVPAGTPLADAILGPPIVEPLSRLLANIGSASHQQMARDLLDAYRASSTMGSAYLALMRRVLEPLGISVLDASHDGVRLAAHPIVQRALTDAAPLAARLADRSAAIVAAGYDPQVTDVPALSLVFSYNGLRKSRVPVAQAAATAASAQPGTLGPNVLLRPIVETSILPTVAYLAGPGEIAYFAQVSAAADALGVDPPLALPRWSGTVIEPRIAALLERRHLTIDDLRDPHAPETRYALAAIPESAREAVNTLRRSIASSLTTLRASNAVPDAVVDGAQHTMQHRIDRLERRLAAAVKRRDTEVMREFATLRAALYPNGKRQERILNFVPFVARHGSMLIDAVRAAVRAHAISLVGTTDFAESTTRGG
jgi:bacillithiol synthase